MSFHILVQTRHPLLGSPTVTIVRVFGALDAGAVPEFAAAIEDVVDRGCPHLVVDLSEVDFLGINGAVALTDARARTDVDGVDMILVVPSPWVEHTIVVTELAADLPRCGSMLQALDAVDAIADRAD